LPDRLRGIAVVNPDVDDATLDVLNGAGCVGARLNLIGRPDPAFSDPEWQRHLHRLTRLHWQVEVQAEAARLPLLLPPLLDAGLTVVVDHFGRPNVEEGVNDPGFRYLLRAARGGRIWVKLSGAYRLGRHPRDEEIARAVIPMLIAELGPARLVWGSDWPHTQHESAAGEIQLPRLLEKWLPDKAVRDAILTTTPARLFGFAAPARPVSTCDATPAARH
jgi:predicted TIM-barrel fold metal-dependent hydrolase